MRLVVTLHGRQYPVTGFDKDPVTGLPTIPRVDMPMMSDEKWDQLCLEDRKKNPGKYAQHEDVDAVIAQLVAKLEAAKRTKSHAKKARGDMSNV